MKQGAPALTPADRAVAVYLLNEHTGSVVRNQIARGIDLSIPERYTLPHQLFLQPFWTEFRPRLSYWRDVLINVLGFMPLGFVFFGYWSSVRPIRRAALAVTVLGFGVSLLIEVLQASIPTRSSGTTDLITNTLGTFIGVLLFRSGRIRLLANTVFGPTLQ
jgi:glycopeptide antibiotics resistance protein